MDWTNWRNEPPTPALKAVEKARFFQPVFGVPSMLFDLTTAKWKHVVSCRFGPPRGGTTKWSGESYRYDIFKKDNPDGLNCKEQFALRFSHGGGDGWFVTGIHAETHLPLMKAIITMDNEEERWDCCHFLYRSITDSIANAVRSARSEMCQAFLEGRMKKRRKQGIVSVVVTSPVTVTTNAA